MRGFELDMGFSVGEVVGGIEALLRKRGMECVRAAGDPSRVTMETRFDGHTARITIRSMPEERRAPLAFPPRTLLAVETGAPAEALEQFRQAILFAFLRVAG